MASRAGDLHTHTQADQAKEDGTSTTNGKTAGNKFTRSCCCGIGNDGGGGHRDSSASGGSWSGGRLPTGWQRRSHGGMTMTSWFVTDGQIIKESNKRSSLSRVVYVMLDDTMVIFLSEFLVVAVRILYMMYAAQAVGLPFSCESCHRCQPKLSYCVQQELRKHRLMGYRVFAGPLLFRLETSKIWWAIAHLKSVVCPYNISS